MSKIANPHSREPWVTLPQAAEYFSISTRTLQRWIEHRRIPARKIGKRCVRVKISQLEDAMTRMGSAA